MRLTPLTLSVTLSVLLPFSALAPAFAQQRPAITGLAYVRFYESDVPGAKHFYGQLLGLRETDAAGGGASFAVGTRQRIEIVPKPVDGAGRLAAVGFLTKDVGAMRRYLEAHGVQVSPVSADEISARDPEGTAIAFVRESRAAEETAGHAGPARATEMVAAGKAGAPTARRMIHAGWMVKSREAEDHFYRDLLGFKPYWYGGMKPDHTDWVSLQVPEGSDWIEYMLGSGASPNPHPDQRELGVLDHTSLGTDHMPEVTAQLVANGMTDPDKRKSQIGKDGKWQLNVFDPDQSRVEFMEYKPVQEPCCSPFTGRQPSAGDAE